LIGLGAGSLAKFLYHHRPKCRITAVEINPQVAYVATHYFRLPEDPKRLSIVIGDGADYMLQGQATFDTILVDGFDADACAGVLDTEPFYQACRARLTAQGILAVNLLGKNRGFKHSVERLSGAFDHRCAVFPSCDSGNVIAFTRGDEAVHVSIDDLRERAHHLKETTGLNLLPTLSRLQLSHPLPDGIFSI
jgi:spermidine synthase